MNISVIIPTLNSERYLAECLAALRGQSFDRASVEIVIADAGSFDATLDIAREFEVEKIIHNELRTGEAGKAAAIRVAEGEFILHVDSDNVPVGDDWLERLAAPLADPEVVSSEVLRWAYDPADSVVNRYQALTGINDPLSLFIGNYDRYSTLTGRWTDYPVTIEKREGWEKVWLESAAVPTMGANGYLVRRTAYDVVPVGDYLFDIDWVNQLVLAGHACIGRVDIPIRHYFCGSIGQFVQKTERRTNDYFYFQSRSMRTYPWTQTNVGAVVRFVFSTITVVPVVLQSVKGYRRFPDTAWWFHPLACWITLVSYVRGVIRRALGRSRIQDRAQWSQ